MSTVTHAPVRFNPAAHKATFLRAIRSELRKLTSLRSTWISFGSLLAVGCTITGIITSGQTVENGLTGTGSISSNVITGGAQFYIVFAIVVAALSVTSEYSSNTMRTTVLSQPKRSRAFLAKLVASCLFIAVAIAVIMGIMLAVGMATAGASWEFGDGHGRALLFFWLATVLTSAITIGIGYCLRSTAGTIVIMFCFLFLLELIVLIPGEFFKVTVPKFIPRNLITSMTSIDLPDSADFIQLLDSSTALLTWTLYAVIFALLGFFRFRRSDV